MQHETQKKLEFKWPMADGVCEEWVTLTTALIRGKRVVVSREVEFVERKLSWREKIAWWLFDKLK